MSTYDDALAVYHHDARFADSMPTVESIHTSGQIGHFPLRFRA